MTLFRTCCPTRDLCKSTTMTLSVLNEALKIFFPRGLSHKKGIPEWNTSSSPMSKKSFSKCTFPRILTLGHVLLFCILQISQQKIILHCMFISSLSGTVIFFTQLASNVLRSWGRPWTWDPPAFTYWGLGLRVLPCPLCAHKPRALCMLSKHAAISAAPQTGTVHHGGIRAVWWYSLWTYHY